MGLSLGLGDNLVHVSCGLVVVNVRSWPKAHSLTLSKWQVLIG